MRFAPKFFNKKLPHTERQLAIEFLYWPSYFYLRLQEGEEPRHPGGVTKNQSYSSLYISLICSSSVVRPALTARPPPVGLLLARGPEPRPPALGPCRAPRWAAPRARLPRPARGRPGPASCARPAIAPRRADKINQRRGVGNLGERTLSALATAKAVAACGRAC